jgi:hypothetical protein
MTVDVYAITRLVVLRIKQALLLSHFSFATCNLFHCWGQPAEQCAVSRRHALHCEKVGLPTKLSLLLGFAVHCMVSIRLTYCCSHLSQALFVLGLVIAAI